MSVRRSAVMGALALSMVGMVAAYRLGRARADGVPMVNPLYYGGMLDDGGRPIEGTRNVTVRLWDAATAGATVCTTNAAGTTFSGGRFRVALDGACVGAVRANPELWVELQVDATTFPRSKLGAVPYALEAGRATSAAGALEARLAAVEARPTGGRQVVIGSWRPRAYPMSDVLPFSCDATDGSVRVVVPVRGEPFSLTFTATATALYQIHRPPWQILRAGANSGFYVGSVISPSVEPVLSVQGELYPLTAGRTYTLSLQAISNTGCEAGSYTISGNAPFVVQQFSQE